MKQTINKRFNDNMRVVIKSYYMELLFMRIQIYATNMKCLCMQTYALTHIYTQTPANVASESVLVSRETH